MSYDLQLHNKNNESCSIFEEDLKKLPDKFSYVIHSQKDDKSIIEFSVIFADKNNLLPEGIRFSLQKKGYFWTWLSYSAPEGAYENFLEIVRQVGETLGLVIDNPQSGQTNIEPIDLF